MKFNAFKDLLYILVFYKNKDFQNIQIDDLNKDIFNL